MVLDHYLVPESKTSIVPNINCISELSNSMGHWMTLRMCI